MRSLSMCPFVHTASVSVSALAMAVVLGSFAKTAHAQDNAPRGAATATQAPADPEVSPPSATSGAAPREESLTVGAYTCTIENTAAPDDEAMTGADVICHSLASHRAPAGAYDIRIGKLGGKLLLVVADHASGTDRRLYIQGMDEVPAAADRIAKAFAENKSVEQTEGTENVVGPDAMAPKQKAVRAGVYLGLTGMGALGTSATPDGGVELDMDFRLRRFALLLQGRAGGIGSAGNKLGYASLGAGGRYFFSDDDVAPFLGLGLGFAYFQANHDDGSDANGSGLNADAEIGLGIFRSSKVSGIASLRADLPVFKLDADVGDSGISAASHYVAPISINLGILFQ